MKIKQSLVVIACWVCAPLPLALRAEPAGLQTDTAIGSATVAPTPALTKSDVDTWLDGVIPFALDNGDVAGAVVAIVKDGAILTEKGYGYSDVAAQVPVDPRTTLFRPGSTSKLFTWTAVMQQVQAGRIDLDKDVNEYLDFKIPSYDGKPVTMRQIMTHTAGFEEALSGLLTNDSEVPSLDKVVKKWIPERIFAPGTTPAYSNYATVLAGYIVQRVSGEPYDEYIAHHILEPLGMKHSTMSEPLPSDLAPLMSKGYSVRSKPPIPFSMVTFRPAGSMSATADDMARFMLAHLDEANNALLNPAISKEMHATALTILPPLNRMELGFYESDLNGTRIIAHGGDLIAFHSDLWLLPDKNVGIFFSMNSAGRGVTQITLRAALIAKFMDRYFPAPAVPSSHFTPRSEDAAAVTGMYMASRRSESGPRAALNFFQQTVVSQDAQGHLQVPGFEFVGADGTPRDWVEVAPFVWKDRFSSERLAAQVQDGKVVRMSVDVVSPFTVYDRVAWYKSTAWLRPTLIVSLFILFISFVSLPAGRLLRWYYTAPRQLEGRERASYLTAAWLSGAVLCILGVWLTVLLSLTFKPLAGWVYILELSTIIALPACCLSNAWFVWTGAAAGRGISRLIWRTISVLASICVLWVAIAFKLTHIGLNY
jgi:CubicO group peptidase (beta-lactamase class C family)